MPTASITPFLIGVSGGPCAGKLTLNEEIHRWVNRSPGKSMVCQKIVEALQPIDGVNAINRVTVIAMENFYKPKTAEQRLLALRGNYNLDHPSAFDDQLLLSTLKELLNGQTVQVIWTLTVNVPAWSSVPLDCSLRFGKIWTYRRRLRSNRTHPSDHRRRNFGFLFSGNSSKLMNPLVSEHSLFLLDSISFKWNCSSISMRTLVWPAVFYGTWNSMAEVSIPS